MRRKKERKEGRRRRWRRSGEAARSQGEAQGQAITRILVYRDVRNCGARKRDKRNVQRCTNEIDKYRGYAVINEK